MSSSLKKIWNTLSTILVALVVILALLLVGARVVGLQVFTVLSGSMEPTYHTGALIYVKKVNPYTITEGQPITFMLDENTIATHRVVGIVPDEEDPTVIRFRTKGDANDAEDGSLVHYKNVIGTPIKMSCSARRLTWKMSSLPISCKRHFPLCICRICRGRSGHTSYGKEAGILSCKCLRIVLFTLATIIPQAAAPMPTKCILRASNR